MTITRIIQDGDSQAILIPHGMEANCEELFISKIGDVFIAQPVDDPWAAARQVIGTFPPDFMEARMQPSWPERSPDLASEHEDDSTPRAKTE